MLHDPHLAPQELQLCVDGELPACGLDRVARHLSICGACRARKLQMESTIVEFVRVHRSSAEAWIPPAAQPRAMLKARLRELDSAPSPSVWAASLPGRRGSVWLIAIASIAVVVFALADS
jgi:anti-sigma factor RsiW